MKTRFLSSGRFRSLLFGLTEGVLLAALVVNVRDQHSFREPKEQRAEPVGREEPGFHG